MKKKIKTSHLFFCEPLHIWSLGTKRIRRIMTVLIVLSECAGEPSHLRGGGEHSSQLLNKDAGVCVLNPILPTTTDAHRSY